jgi:hypothetical protein
MVAFKSFEGSNSGTYFQSKNVQELRVGYRANTPLGTIVRKAPVLSQRILEIGVQANTLQPWQRAILRQEAARARRLRNSVKISVFELF